MSRNEIQFINKFIDAVTLRPFLDDLRRIKQTSNRYSMPAVGRVPSAKHEAA